MGRSFASSASVIEAAFYHRASNRHYRVVRRGEEWFQRRHQLDTAGAEVVTHLNNAGSALPPRPVVEAVIEHLRLEEQIGGYEAAAAKSEAIEHTYDAVARLLGAHRDEIAIVENATRAWDMAFYGIDFKEGDRILTGTSEYASNVIAFLQMEKRRGTVVDVIPDDEHGQLDVQALAARLDKRVKLIADRLKRLKAIRTT